MRRKGEKGRPGRWFQIFDAGAEKDGELMVLCVILVYLGLRDSYWPSVEDSPLGGLLQGGARSSSLDTASASKAGEPTPTRRTQPGAQPDVQSKVPVKASSRELNAVRAMCQNTLDLACRILADERSCRLVEGVRHCVAPVHASFGAWLTASKTQRGMMELRVQWALGEQVTATALQALQSLQGGEGFERIDFAPAADTSVPEAKAAADRHIASRLFAFVSVLVGMRLANKLQHSHSLPGIFALLLSPTLAIREGTLQRLRCIWESLEKLGMDAERDVHAAGFVKGLCWPAFVWIREVFVLLAEYEFRLVPPIVEETLRALFRSLLLTNICEVLFNGCRQRGTIQRRGALSRSARHHAMLLSGIFEDSDRKLPAETPESR